jgi:hypothetical protein
MSRDFLSPREYRLKVEEKSRLHCNYTQRKRGLGSNNNSDESNCLAACLFIGLRRSLRTSIVADHRIKSRTRSRRTFNLAAPSRATSTLDGINIVPYETERGSTRGYSLLAKSICEHPAA